MGLTSVISNYHLLSILFTPFSSVAVLHLLHIPAIQILHGFQCLVAVGYEAEEQASFRRFDPDQKGSLMYSYSKKKKSLNDRRLIIFFVVCSSPAILVLKFGLISGPI